MLYMTNEWYCAFVLAHTRQYWALRRQINDTLTVALTAMMCKRTGTDAGNKAFDDLGRLYTWQLVCDQTAARQSTFSFGHMAHGIMHCHVCTIHLNCVAHRNYNQNGLDSNQSSRHFIPPPLYWHCFPIAATSLCCVVSYNWFAASCNHCSKQCQSLGSWMFTSL